MENNKLKYLSEGRLDLFLSATGDITKSQAKKEASYIINEAMPELEQRIIDYENEFTLATDALDNFLKSKTTSTDTKYIKSLYGKDSFSKSEYPKVTDSLISRCDWLEDKIKSEYKVGDNYQKRLDELANMYAGVERKIKRELRQQAREEKRKANITKKDAVKQAKSDIEVIYSRILTCEKNITDLDVKFINYTAEANKLEPKIKDRTAKSSELKRFAELLDLIPQIDTDIQKLEQTITSYNKDIDSILSKYDSKKLDRYSDRKARQTARKDKRNSKRLIKDVLKKNYGTGAEFRKLWEKWKSEIKTEKKEEISEHGGTTLHRIANKVNKIPMIATRNAVLALMELNAFNIAGRMLNKKQTSVTEYNKILNKWEFFGGKKSALDKSVTKNGIKKAFPPFGTKVIPEGSKSASANGDYLNATGIEEVTAFLAAAAPYLAAIAPLLGTINGLLGVTGDKESDDAIDDISYDDAYARIDSDMSLTDAQRTELKKLIDSGMSVDDAYAELGLTLPIDDTDWIWWTVGIGGIIVAGLLIWGIASIGKKSKS